MDCCREGIPAASFPGIFSNTGLITSSPSLDPRMECKSLNEKKGSLRGSEVMQLLGLFFKLSFSL